MLINNNFKELAFVWQMSVSNKNSIKKNIKMFITLLYFNFSNPLNFIKLENKEYKMNLKIIK